MERINWNEIEKIKDIIKNSLTKSEVLEKIGLLKYGGNFNTLTSFINDNNIDIKHFNNTKNGIISKYENIYDVLIEKSPYKSTNNLKKRLYKENIKERKCEMCGQDEIWNNKKISLILDHINGINNDNRLENLRIVCPNCNATLDTHCGKNIKSKKEKVVKSKKEKVKKKCEDCKVELRNYRAKKCILCNGKSKRKIERPDYDTLIKDIDDLGYRGTGIKYGVSDNSIRKWIKI